MYDERRDDLSSRHGGDARETASEAELVEYLAECRALVLAEIERFMPTGRRAGLPFYDLMRDYPLRRAKALRPALCIATCRALGGALEAVLPTSAALELYHNAFLIHDDVEDGSLLRRDEPTLHVKHGVPIAVNVGDGMLALALEPLLENTRVLGLSRALRILRLVATMARESAEGQAMELGWVRDGRWSLRDADYVRMVHKKTSYYSFITPMVVGGLAAGAGHDALAALFRFAARLGAAFQIQDDVLNLVADERAYGKEIGGDLWEGKHTLILLHMMRTAAPDERREAELLLAKDRPRATGALGCRPARTAADVDRLLELIHARGSIEYARRAASIRAAAAGRTLDSLSRWMGPSIHRKVLRTLVDFVTHRDR
jgi:geranylgeranyl diphosphate synthase type II